MKTLMPFLKDEEPTEKKTENSMSISDLMLDNVLKKWLKSIK